MRGAGAGSGGGTERQVLDVYVPVHAGDVADPDPARDAGDVIGAAEVMLDHTAAGAALADAVRTLALVVAVGLLALWMVLFRTVWTASRRLQATALENARLALLDSLTGLPNRRMLAERMRRTVLEAEETGSRVGLMLLDIDRFKDINDSLGHDRGDELLEQVAERLRGALRDDDVVARLGGDEFAILLPDVRSVANAEQLQARGRRVVLVGRVHRDAGAVVLRRVHRHVRGTHERRRVRRVVGQARDAHRGVHVQRQLAEHERRDEQPAHASGQPLGVRDGAHVGQEDRELVATEARDDVVVPQAPRRRSATCSSPSPRRGRASMMSLNRSMSSRMARRGTRSPPPRGWCGASAPRACAGWQPHKRVEQREAGSWAVA